MYEYRMQLADLATGRAILDTVTFQVVEAGAPNRIAIYDMAGVASANPATGIGGAVNFKTAETVESVDIYGITSKGYAFQLKNVKPGDRGEVVIDSGRLNQVIVIPFDIVDTEVVAATECLSGFKLPQYFSVLPDGLGVFIETADSGITIDVGTNSTTGTDDPNGFIAAGSAASLGVVNAQVGYVNGTNSIYVDLTGGTAEWTYGELMHPASTKGAKAEGIDSATTKNGIAFLVPHVATGGTASLTEEITFTLSSGADTAAGFLVIPGRVHLPQ